MDQVGIKVNSPLTVIDEFISSPSDITGNARIKVMNSL